MPLVFNYSSKIWRLELSGYGESGTTAFTTNIPRYAEKSAMGWTSSFGTAQIEAFEDIYDCHGNPLGEAMDAHIPPPPFGSTELPEGYCGEGIYYITRVRVKLPDGSTQELRKDDFIHEYNASPIDWSGTYLATDGSRSRLEMSATGSVLYLPDGERYYFQVPTGGSDQIGYRYEDRHGNRLDFNVSTRTWTDTLGRSLVSPIPLNLAEQEQSAGTQTFTMPGLTGTPNRQYQLVWKNLGDSGVLLNPGETLYYPGSRDCPNGSEQGGNALFQGDVETRICRGALFNPVVLTEIVLPNQLRYKFWYNRYGEITQIEYPTGTSERFEYSAMPLLNLHRDSVQQQTNRGVINRTNSYRGNLTSIRSYMDIVYNQFIETHHYFDKYGNLRKSVDARGFESQTEYGADYASAYPTKTISPVPDPGGVSGSNAPLETIVSYDFNTGLPRYKTDPNNQTTEIQYNDSLLRPTRAIAPNGQQTTTEYGALTSDATRFVKVRTQIDAEKWKESYTWLDGFGRTIKTQSIDSAGDVFVITNYDEMGRVKAVSNPFRNVSNPTCATNLECATTVYDAFGRVWKVTAPDGAITETTYTLATVGSQIGNVVTVRDAAAKERRSITNALGQLVRVDEPNDAGQLGAIQSPAQPTFYAYDTLNNLKTVTQGEQTRTFAYDALSRLKSATNPESGTISYAYDPNGNLLTKTDARGVLTTYVYDPLNRVRSRTYGNEPGGQTPTPAVSYFYDNLPNAKGKLIKVGNAVSTTEFTAFDVSGRPTAHAQTTDGQTYATAYSYNLAGLLTEQTYPNGRTVKNVLDADGELSIVQSRKNQNAGFWNYARHFSYTPSGAVSSMQLGNGRWESTVFNSRLQPVRIALGATPNGSDLLKLDFTYNTPGANDNNGNVRTQTVTVPTIGNNQGFTAVQSYAYDSLNRIKQASESVAGSQTWKQTFSYDRYGNRNFDTGGGNTTTLESGSLPKVVNPEILASNNRFKADQDDDGINDYLYDAAGNTTRDALNRTFVYDGENKQIEVLENNVSLGKYFYDGDGRHVKKVSATETVIFVYDATGKLIAEYANQTGGSSSPKVAYLTTDHLGSPRINTDALGSVISRHNYRPFGEEIERAGYAMDDVRKQFTGYERDKETDLDFAKARYFNSASGRFFSPDSLFYTAARPADPQQFNLYVYVRNNPLLLVDPDG